LIENFLISAYSYMLLLPTLCKLSKEGTFDHLFTFVWVYSHTPLLCTLCKTTTLIKNFLISAYSYMLLLRTLCKEGTFDHLLLLCGFIPTRHFYVNCVKKFFFSYSRTVLIQLIKNLDSIYFCRVYSHILLLRTLCKLSKEGTFDHLFIFVQVCSHTSLLCALCKTAILIENFLISAYSYMLLLRTLCTLPKEGTFDHLFTFVWVYSHTSLLYTLCKTTTLIENFLISAYSYMLLLPTLCKLSKEGTFDHIFAFVRVYSHTLLLCTLCKTATLIENFLISAYSYMLLLRALCKLCKEGTFDHLFTFVRVCSHVSLLRTLCKEGTFDHLLLLCGFIPTRRFYVHYVKRQP
jgi:hypothetical protein